MEGTMRLTIHPAMTVLLMVLLTACATDTQSRGGLTGSSGPITWEVTDLKVRHSGDRKLIRWYYTLVLRETEGRAIQFETLQSGIYGPGVDTSTLRKGGFTSRLAAHSELRLNYAPYMRSNVGGAMIVFYRFSGRDDSGRAVTLDVRVPLSGVRGSSSASAFTAPLPPPRSLKAEDLSLL
jgi:hypothetical protein